MSKMNKSKWADSKHPYIEGNDSGFEKVELPKDMQELPKDMVNQPSHYNYGEIECIDAIKGMLGEEGFKAYCRGNAMKYTWRAGLKFDEVEDLKKASWYNRMAAGDDPRLDAPKEEKMWLYPSAAMKEAANRYNRMAAGDDPLLDDKGSTTQRTQAVVINTKTGTIRPLTEREQQVGGVTELGPDEQVTMQFLP